MGLGEVERKVYPAHPEPGKDFPAWEGSGGEALREFIPCCFFPPALQMRL